MTFYHKLSYYGKLKRTLTAGIPILIVTSVLIICLAPTTTQKIVVPTILLIIWIIQTVYTYRKSKLEENRIS